MVTIHGLNPDGVIWAVIIVIIPGLGIMFSFCYNFEVTICNFKVVVLYCMVSETTH